MVRRNSHGSAARRCAQPSSHPPRRRPGPLAWAPLLALGLAACGGSDDGPDLRARSLSEACPAYQATGLPHNAKLTGTEIRPAQGSLPEVCIVRGEIVSSPESTIRWAVELPQGKLWNTKTLTIGGGGFDGFIPTDDPWYQDLVGPSANPYVKISSDSGHQVRSFAWGNSDVALRNHAFDANHVVLEVGTAIATGFYGTPPTRRYHMGQSNGGRSALVSTQKYPKDYDGVIAMEPAIAQQAHQVNLGPTVLRHIFSRRENWMSAEKIALFARAEMAACDALDGLEDGIIGNVEACHYVPTDLLCTGAENATCLTAGQIESIRLIYASHDTPVTLSRGARGYPRYGRGGASTSDWQSYMFGSSFEARDAFNFMAAQEAARLVEHNPSLSLLDHDPTRFQAQYTRLAEMIDATDPDIAAFADNGGKMLIWYGVSDTCVSMYRAVEYFDAVQQRLGASKVKSFARFLTSPTVGHDLDGATDPRAIDLLAAMDRWVTEGTAPDQLVDARLAPGGKTHVLQRPVCAYPQFPRYNGSCDPSKADSFSCSAV